MSVFLVQHGLSLPKTEDPEKGLSEKGREETLKIAEVAAGYSVKISKIFHSGKKRAKQTALIMAEILCPGSDIEQMADISAMDDVKALGDRLGPDSNHMVVGHLPYMEKLVSYLTTGREAPKVLKFQNSGIVCLDQDESGWFIRWTLNPNIS
ncbi:phosphohistidine phosphatase SixA [uncultured Desulfobacter sp.]|uniref:phosphohistidine phosphatase SixA n=1 Tax=uncultured Desulfobacter sp. TaxID=240139 RepID=UPI002AA6E1A7|nr:phosphohistidine phosphatase SixA [uncultured Desulfobacter sp.]